MTNTHAPITLDSKPVLAWTAPTRPTVERTKRWYVTAAIVIGVIVVYAVATGAWTLAIVSILAGAMYPLVHGHPSPTSSIELHDSGILHNGEFTRWDQFEAFWFLRTPTYNEVRFIPRRGAAKHIAMQTGNNDLAQLRMVISQRLPESTKKKESFLDAFIRICKL